MTNGSADLLWRAGCREVKINRSRKRYRWIDYRKSEKLTTTIFRRNMEDVESYLLQSLFARALHRALS